VLEYEHGLRVIVHTANKIHCDCNSKSQVQSKAWCTSVEMHKQMQLAVLHMFQHDVAWLAGLVGARLPPQGTDWLPALLRVSILVAVPVVRAFFMMTALGLQLKDQSATYRLQGSGSPETSRFQQDLLDYLLALQASADGSTAVG
jgi:hypothetical protein